MKPYLSIVIPYYNDPQTITRLLGSIARSKRPPSYEVIVVDDGSADKAKFQMTNAKWEIKKLHLRLVSLEKNMGPAVARNRGVAVAKGRFIVFLDSDVELFADTLFNIWKVFDNDPDVVALTGVWVKEQHTHDFFPNFKALRDWSYWINERDKSGYYFLFSTRIAAIKRSVFLRLGGFDEQYPAPLVEDIELTYRIARRYAIIFAPQVRVRHEFEAFIPIAKKYFLRAYYWTRLYMKRKKFDPVATTLQEAITTLSAVGTVFFAIMSVFAVPTVPLVIASIGRLPSPVVVFASLNYILLVLFLLFHLFLVRRFMVFTAREKGIVFAVKSFLVGLVLYCVIFSGALLGRLAYLARR